MPDTDDKQHEGNRLPVTPARTYAAADLLDPAKRAAIDAEDAIVRDLALDAAFAKGAGDNGRLVADRQQDEASYGGATTAAQSQRLADLVAGAKLLHIARDFIRENKVTCPEATVNDRVYENAPGLVEKLGEIVGFYDEPEEQG